MRGAWLLVVPLALPAQAAFPQARSFAPSGSGSRTGFVHALLVQAASAATGTPQAGGPAASTPVAPAADAAPPSNPAGPIPSNSNATAGSAGPPVSAGLPGAHRHPSQSQQKKAQEMYLKGVRAMAKGDAAAAEKNFTRAAQADPTNHEYDIDRQIARSQAVAALVHSADKARIQGHPELAGSRLKQALALDPTDPEAIQHIPDISALSPADALDDATVTIQPEIQLAPTRGWQSFHFHATEQETLRRVLSAYGLSPTIDSSVGTERISFDADNVDFAQAAKMLELATDTFMVPLDPKRALVAKDNRENRLRYERQSEETLLLPGLSQEEMQDLGNIARSLLEIQHVQPNADAMTVRAPQPVLTALNRTFADLLQGNSEVLLDVKIYQIARTKTLNIGVLPPQSFTLFNVPSELNSIIQQNQSLVQQIISSGLANATDYSAIAAILIASGEVSSSILSQPFALFGGGLTESGVSVPAVTANLALNSSDTRALDQVQLRLSDNQEGTIRSGERYPIETSSYSNLAASSVNIPGLTSSGLSSTLAGLGVNLNSLTSSATIPQVQYQDLGLTLTVTPKVERDDVALKLDMKLTGLEGSSLNGLPVLTNQSYTADVVVGTGDSTVLVTNMSRQESKAVSGIPGLSDLPGFQSTTNDQTEQDTSSLVILITPHLLRRGHGETAGPYIPLPLRSGS